MSTRAHPSLSNSCDRTAARFAFDFDAYPSEPSAMIAPLSATRRHRQSPFLSMYNSTRLAIAIDQPTFSSSDPSNAMFACRAALATSTYQPDTPASNGRTPSGVTTSAEGH